MMRGRLLAREGECARHSKHSLRRSRKQESSVESDLPGAKKVPASGARWHSKGDVKSPEYLVECKTTEKQSYTLKVEDLKKLTLQAAMARRTPVMQVEFGSGGKWAVINWDLFLEAFGHEGSDGGSEKHDEPVDGDGPRIERRVEEGSVRKGARRLGKGQGPTD